MNGYINESAGSSSYTATRNACKLCTPLGAAMVFMGIENCIPILHGSQGCSTYIRRYMISHCKEPVDIASTNFSESSTIFGGKANLFQGLDNVIKQYKPDVVGIASTCLSETIGDDVSMFIHEYKRDRVGTPLPVLINVSTPSYQGTHMEGFHAAVKEIVKALAEKNEPADHVNIFPGFVSAEDIRYLKEVLEDFNLPYVMLPDYSETLDGGSWSVYRHLPKGGTKTADIKTCGSAKASIQFGRNIDDQKSSADYLESACGVPAYKHGLPIGLRESDRFFESLSAISKKSIPLNYENERSRLIDAYADGHKYVFGKKAIIYGEEDLVTGLVSFMDEIGIKPVLVASGAESGMLRKSIENVIHNIPDTMRIEQSSDFEDIAELARTLSPDIIIGNSKGYYIARELNIPIVRVGFPIHDRIGGQRILHVGYKGALQLYDLIANALIMYKQDNSPVGYKYM